MNKSMLQSSSADSSDSSDSYDSSSPYYGPSSDSADQPEPSPMQYQQQQQQARPAASRQQYSSGNRDQAIQSARLQQAPSQQRGVPQQFYAGSSLDEDGQDQVGSAPSNSKHTQEYQMGADLGPTIDDKEMQGVFNSNDDRDDDDGAPAGAGYEPIQAGRSRAASNSAYSPSSGLGDNSGSRYRGPAQDEDSADEEDESPRGTRGGQSGGRQARRGGYLNQAASQFRQRPSAVGGGQDGSGSMLAAANGYAPYGYANGPVDLSSMMAGMSGPAGFGPSQMFQGDGSYPGANYYQQQASGPRQRGARNQAESAANGYYNNGYAGQQPSSEGSANQRDRDDSESEADDDRRKA